MVDKLFFFIMINPHYYLVLWISLDITRYYLVVDEHFFSAAGSPPSAPEHLHPEGLA
jgi:hypothetical protein